MIIRRRGGCEFGEITIRRDDHAVGARLWRQDSRQLHRHRDLLDFFLRTFGRHGHDYEIQPPQRKRQRDIRDAVGKRQPYSAASIYMQRPNLRRQFADLPRQFAVSDDHTFLYKRRLLRPARGSLFYQFSQIHWLKAAEKWQNPTSLTNVFGLAASSR